MKNIGYIVSKRKIKDLMGGIGVVNDVSLIAPNYPYLIVGLEEAKKNIENFSIFKKQIDEYGSWTFGKTERRNDFEKDVNLFYKNVINNIINNTRYYYINILNIKYNKFKNMYNIINSSERKYIYISNDMMYIYVNNYILGISLQLLKYCKVDTKKIIDKISANENNIITTSDSFLSFKLKGLIKDKKYLVSYFMALQ